MAEVLRRTDEVDDPLGLEIRMDGGEVDWPCPVCGEGRLTRNDRLELVCDQCGYVEASGFNAPPASPF